VSEFAFDIFRYLKHRETSFRVSNYFNEQSEFDRKARANLVDWLVKMQVKCKYGHETLYLAVKLMDLFVSKTQQRIDKPIFNLVACVAFFVASKVEERFAPAIDDLLYLCKHAYTADQLKKTERQMLRVIGFDLSAPLSYSFLHRYGRVIKSSMKVHTAARYFLETSLHYLGFCVVSESRMAAACLLLALRVTKTGVWNSILEKYSGYKLIDIEPLMRKVNHTMHRFGVEHKGLNSVRYKYLLPEFFEVAKLPLLTDFIQGSVE